MKIWWFLHTYFLLLLLAFSDCGRSSFSCLSMKKGSIRNDFWQTGGFQSVSSQISSICISKKLVRNANVHILAQLTGRETVGRLGLCNLCLTICGCRTQNSPLDWSKEMLVLFQKTSSRLVVVTMTWSKLYMYFFLLLFQRFWELYIYSFVLLWWHCIGTHLSQP